MNLLETVETETGSPVRGSVIWLHGLGADGHDFEPVVPLLRLPELPLRYVFPHAPVRPVTLNAGMSMRAWFDIVSLDRHGRADEEGIRTSEAQVRALIEREKRRGIPAEAIVLAGFSQGGAIALHTGVRYPERLAGVIALSCYLPLREVFDAEADAANRSTSLFIGHGTTDALVPLVLGQETRGFLEERGYAVEWRTYPMEHAVCPEEIQDIRSWLAERF